MGFSETMLVGRPGLFLDSLAMRLRDMPDVHLAAVVTEPAALLTCQHLRADVALVDLSLGHALVAEISGKLRSLRPRIALIALQADPQADTSATVLSAGFTGWVGGADACDELSETIRAVRDGLTRIPIAVLMQAVRVTEDDRQVVTANEERLARLTWREREVLDLLSEGYRRDEIARRLLISPNTVRTHTQHVLGKLQVRQTLAAVAILREVRLHAEAHPGRPTAPEPETASTN